MIKNFRRTRLQLLNEKFPVFHLKLYEEIQYNKT